MPRGERVYLDYNATTPMDPDVVEAMVPYLTGPFGNPSSPHSYGQEARRALEDARAHVARLLECEPLEVIFTSGGTESNNLALRGAMSARLPSRDHLVIAAVEHVSVRETALALESEGYRLSVVPVGSDGRVRVEDVQAVVEDRTSLVSLMLANNETGALQPVEELGAELTERGILLHCDAVQALGKVPFSLRDLHADLVSLTAHKFYGPRGVGILFVRSGTPLRSALHGGSQEKGLRPGTENVAGAIGFSRALERALSLQQKESRRIVPLRDRIEESLLHRYPDRRILSADVPRLPNTLCVEIPGVPADRLVIALDLEGIAISAGAACHSGAVRPSATLAAMGLTLEEARCVVRISLGRETDDAAVIRLLTALDRVRDRIAAGETLPQSPEEDVPTDDAAGVFARIEKAYSDIGRVGKYELLEEIGRGGMGIVYRARIVGTNEEVALKVLRDVDDAEDVARFEREARIAARLKHPGIIPILETGFEDGTHFFTMPLVTGPSLADFLEREALPERNALKILAAACETLQFAHEQGVIHRDLKPSNILLDTENDRPLLADFGLVRTIRGGSSSLTLSGSVLGTPVYMAPEQAGGRVREIGPHTDVYGLGAILYEMLTRQPPFEGRTVLEILAKVLNDRPVRPAILSPDVSLQAEYLCLRAMAKDRRLRYPTAEALRRDVLRVLDGQDIIPPQSRKPLTDRDTERSVPDLPFLLEAVPRLVVEIEDRNGVAILTLSGVLDYDTLGILENAVSSQLLSGIRRIVMDGSGITYANRAGAALILENIVYIRDHGGDVAMARLHGRPRQVLRRVGLLELVTHHEDVDAACEVLRAPAEEEAEDEACS